MKRACGWASAVGVLLAALATARTTGSIEGVVLDISNGSGIAGVAVKLKNSPQNETVSETQTSAKGAFQFAGLSPGAYRIELTKDGYIYPPEESYFGPDIQVAGGAEAANIRMALVRLATLKGRVTDENGDPAPGASVELANDLVLVGSETAKTGADGGFAIDGVAPGTYLLRAMRSAKRGAPSTVAASGDRDPCRNLPDNAAWAPQYFPLAPGHEAASPITVNGADQEGFDFKLPCTAPLRVSGVVTGESGEPLAGASVTMISADAPEDLFEPASQRARTVSGPDGEFEFPAVAPGDWWITAEVGERLMAGRRRVTLTQDYDAVRLRVEAPFTFEASAAGLENLGKTGGPDRLILFPMDAPPALASIGSLGPLGSAKMVSTKVSSGRYLLIEPAPEGYYLDSIQVGDRPVHGLELDVSPNMPPVKLIFKTDGGRVQGKVESARRVLVVFAPLDLESPSELQATQSDATGIFESPLLRPGSYRVVAIDGLDQDYLDNPSWVSFPGASDRLSRFWRSATEVKVEKNQVSTVTLRGAAHYR